MDTPSASGLEATIQITPSSAGSAASRNLALHFTGGEQLTNHERQLLRVRLKVASLVLFAGFLLFLIMALVWFPEEPRLLISHIITTITLGLCGFSLCRNCHANGLRLRIEEAIVFGMPASFFALAEVLSVIECATKHAFLPDPFPPWITLIFTYALFIPNRVRRATIVISLMALTPVVILAILLATNSVCQQAVNAEPMFFVKSMLTMLMTAVVASLGAARIGVLRSRAFAAEELGQYRLEKRIGKGGMGEVFLAEHRLIKRPCAVKLIRQDKANDPQAIARFEREVQTAATLTHWNSVNVYDYGHTEDGTFYFVMEYLAGMSLQQLVDEHGPLPPGRAVYFLRQICNALQEAHELGLVHRDVKPANIFAAKLGVEHDVAKLLDFGLVKHVDAEGTSDLTMMGFIAGSPLFMSPENATGDEEPDARSDIYSLGAVAYFLLTGTAPFPGDQPLKVLMAHANQPVPPPSSRCDVPADVEAIVMSCLEKTPADRPPSAAVLEQMLAKCESANDWCKHRAGEWWANLNHSLLEPAFAGSSLGARQVAANQASGAGETLEFGGTSIS